jgi:hypothetical protein
MDSLVNLFRPCHGALEAAGAAARSHVEDIGPVVGTAQALEASAEEVGEQGWDSETAGGIANTAARCSLR